ncbi:MAG: hypothetical protein GZ091_15920 [Paludibacter sp.]|nr:hypothetical protein [Paludibacter sp.]
MNTVNVQIDITTPTGRRLLREVEKHPKVAKIEHELPEAIAGQKTYSLDESYEKCCDILSANYGVDVRKL